MAAFLKILERFPYLAALAAVAACLAIRYAMDSFVGETSHYSIFFFAVAFAAAIGGWRVGVFTEFISAAAGHAFAAYSPAIRSIHSSHHYEQLIIFLLVSALIIAIAENARRLRQRAESDARLVREAERYFRAIFENAAVGIATIDRAGRFIQVNKILCKVLGRDCREFAGKSFADFTHPEDIAADMEKYARLMAGRLENYVIEKRYITGAGRIIWVLAYRAAVAGEDGRPDFSIGVAVDITDRKRAEAKLRRFYNAPMLGVIYFTMDGKVTDANDRFLEMTGYSRAQLEAGLIELDKVRTAEYKEADRRACEELKAAGVSEPYEKTLLRRDGTEISVITGAAMLDETRSEGVAFVYDITKRKEAEDKLKKTQARLEENVRELEDIISFISHDLRSPLVNIRGFSKELAKDALRLTEMAVCARLEPQARDKCAQLVEKDIPESLQFIEASANFMDSVIASLVKLARIGMAAVNPEPVDMDELCGEVIKSLETRIKDSGVEIRLEPLGSCIADGAQMAQVLTNLIDNAIKYREPSRPGIIRISGRVEGPQCIYTIADNGIGIDTKEHENIFKMFYRLGSKDVGGDGIGLSMVKRMLERGGGRIWLESEPGRGTKFHIALPKA